MAGEGVQGCVMGVWVDEGLYTYMSRGRMHRGHGVAGESGSEGVLWSGERVC